ncbi:MAG TPA: arginyltransferase, partial [Burkholderiales bacterium]|nr:arginyltransferase [Burkholderiales bacterium]
SPDRSQKRSVKRHGMLSVQEKELRFDPEHFELYCRYQKVRHPGGGMDNDSEDQYRNSLLLSQADTSLYEFRENGKLTMVSIVDEVGDGLSSVYTFFDPALPGASLGTYNVLWQIDLCRKLNLPYLYLGYWIEQCKKMAYKINFQPLQGYIGGKWQTMDK